MKLFMPKQHGAWAMLFVPFFIGMSQGGASWWHLPLIAGWIAVYLATYPLLLMFKGKKVAFYRGWFLKYAGVAAVILLPVVYMHPNLFLLAGFMLPFFLVNIYFSRRNQERSFFNDAAAISSMSVGAIASYYIGSGLLFTWEALLGWGLSVLFFLGSTFFVKSLIRERKNPAYRWKSWGYHLGIILAALLFEPLIALAYGFSAVRAVMYYGKNKTPIQIGVMEIVNSVYFTAVASIVLVHIA